MLNRLLLLISVALSVACSGEPANAEKTADAWPAFDAPEPASAENSPAKSPLPRACDLVSAAAAEQVLAQHATLMSDEAESCMWSSADHPGSITMLMVLVSDNDSEATAQEVFGAVTGMQGNLSALVNQHVDAKTKKSGQELDDLGDEAWLSASNMDLIGTQQLVVRKGTRVLTLNVTGMGKTEGLGKRLEAVARQAVPQL
ncbi:hypothetical protein C7S18_19685 [Ahniella affigens]|uniref:DUF3558 domain-containing protein n=1 Tax=Ahniella affigens TaxID=2021234 RepID=A0A2P1PWL8_9GAMM|nr:hypothetical protein [Ahniella affigens]AVP99248.1 hypothetical protein C7S18_19685 [Ahniella affigens]